LAGPFFLFFFFLAFWLCASLLSRLVFDTTFVAEAVCNDIALILIYSPCKKNQIVSYVSKKFPTKKTEPDVRNQINETRQTTQETKFIFRKIHSKQNICFIRYNKALSPQNKSSYIATIEMW
jgi:hypothetical protein